MDIDVKVCSVGEMRHVLSKKREIKDVNVTGVAEISKDKMCQQCK